MNRRPLFVEQASTAINARRCRFLAAERSTVVYTYAPCLRIACVTGNNREILGCVPWNERLYPNIFLWSENAVGCGNWIGLPLGETGPQFSVADWRCLVLRRLMQWWEAERLQRSGRPVERKRQGCLRPGPQLWFGCGMVVCWTKCFSGSRSARPMQVCSRGVGIGTVCGPHLFVRQELAKALITR